MQAYQVQSTDGIEEIKKVDLPMSKLADDELLVRMKACSLNYRDLLITQGGYPRNDMRPVIPLSDGAGEVVEIGAAVKGFEKGDRVAGNFFQGWVSGNADEAGLGTAMGGGIDGVLAEFFVLKAAAAVSIPEQLSFEEAATLPCAALTAWHALIELGDLQEGETVLTQGTGGVSIFVLQICKALGANVIITSSSNEKLESAKDLGADHLINYIETPDWEQKVLEITEGKGVDHVIELGGEATFEKSIAASKIHGTISVIGILSGFNIPFNLQAAFNLLRINGVYVGSVEMFKSMMTFFEKNKIKPQIDRVFEFDDAVNAYRYLASARHFGKVVIANNS